MLILARVVAAIVVFIGGFFFSFWMVFAQLLPKGLVMLGMIPALLVAGFASRFAWRSLGQADPGVVATACRWALIAGAAGFCGGFFGPMIFTPQANQGPLLGLFITGPLGVVGGAIAGLIRGLWVKAHRPPGPTSTS